MKRLYYAMCAKVDDLSSMVVDALKERGLYDDTLILFFSDHGDFTGDYSLPEKTHSTMQDCLMRVPLVVKPPAGVPVKRGNRQHLAFPYHVIGSHAIMCRTHKHKYIRRFYTGHHELFDLVLDPGETKNVSGHPEYAEVERQCETRLLDYFMHTGDVLPHQPDSRRV